MKTTIIAAAAAVISFAAPAMAWEGRVVACYDSTWVPDEYEVHKTLHSAAHTKWEHRGKQLVEVYYAPVYEEVLVPATYTVKKVKLKDAYQQYERQANGLVYLLEYPAVFREDRTLHTEEHIVMRPVTCE